MKGLSLKNLFLKLMKNTTLYLYTGCFHQQKDVTLKSDCLRKLFFHILRKNLKKFRLEEYHPYIKSRIKQENTAFSLADDSFSVVVLELPYIFGIQEGRKPVWSIFIERFHRPKIIFFPKGGTSMVTLYQVGIAIYHAILYGENKTAYPLGYVQMPWRVLIKKVLSSMKQKKLIITVPNWMAQLGFNALQKSYEKKGLNLGSILRNLSNLCLIKRILILRCQKI